MPEDLDLTAEELANWLIERAPDRLWNVEDEDQIEEALSLPCTGTDLAAELRKRGGRLRILGTMDPNALPHRTTDLGRLSRFAYGTGDEIMFRVAWLNDGSMGRQWFIVTDLLAEEATRSAHAS